MNPNDFALEPVGAEPREAGLQPCSLLVRTPPERGRRGGGGAAASGRAHRRAVATPQLLHNLLVEAVAREDERPVPLTRTIASEAPEAAPLRQQRRL